MSNQCNCAGCRGACGTHAGQCEYCCGRACSGEDASRQQVEHPGVKLKCQTAKKDHRCDSCGRKIPEGSRYWRRHVTEEGHVATGLYGFKEHSNCLEFEHEPVLPLNFNNNLPKRRGDKK